MSFGIPVRNGLGIGLTSSTSLSSGARGVIRPALFLDFIGTTSLDSRITFTRGTTATFVGSDGLIQTAAINGPRFDYDPVTLAAKGLLIEEQRVNLVTYSEQFNNAAWSKSNVTVTADTTVAPDGTTTADTLTASTAAAFTWQVISFTGDGDKTMSCFVKAGTAATSVVQIRDATVTANRGYFIITWTAGVPSVAPLTTGTVLGVDAFGNGWYRLRLLATGVVAANSNQYRFLPDTTSGTGTVIAWGAQAENGSFATSYIPTVASQVTRSADVATMTGTNFSSWYNAAEGSFVFEGSTQLGATRHFLNGQTTNDRFLSSSAAGSISISDLTNSAVGGIIAANTTFKAAVSYGLGGLAASLNGGTAGTSAYSGVFASVNELQIGRRGALYIIGHIRQIAYYNTQLPDATLQTLTEIPGAYNVDLLIIAGGGSGGSNINGGGGGGGAGGYLAFSAQVFVPGDVKTITVGAGGTAAASGSNSSVTGLTTAVGGGAGGSDSTGSNGGSGGGGGGIGPSAGGSPTSGQGFKGGDSGGSYGTAGGGGAGAVGNNGAAFSPAGGGNGLASSITGTSVTRAGGGGGGNIFGAGPAGGTGGGGAGAGPGVNAVSGSANTGSGGGGQISGVAIGTGGSGVVILSVPTAKYTGTTTGSPTVTTSGANTIMTFTSSGSYTA